MTWRSRLLSLLVASVLPAVASVAAVPANPASAMDTSDDCQVVYLLAAEWPGGFYGMVTLANVGDTISSGWEVTLDFPNGQTIRPPWDPIGFPPLPGEPIRIRNTAWNGVLHPNQQVTFGLLGTYSGTNGPPTVACVLFL